MVLSLHREKKIPLEKLTHNESKSVVFTNSSKVTLFLVNLTMPIKSKVFYVHFGRIPNDYEMHSSQKNGLGMYVNHRITIDSYILSF